MWIDRELGAALLRVGGSFSALLLTGPRQVGKTSLLRHAYPEASYVTLDDASEAARATSNPAEFVASFSRPLIIDEVQYAPRLFRSLKAEIDRKRDQNGQYYLTGSQKFVLMQNVTESLAGRVAVLNCHSLSAMEIEKWSRKSVEGGELLELIFRFSLQLTSIRSSYFIY